MTTAFAIRDQQYFTAYLTSKGFKDDHVETAGEQMTNLTAVIAGITAFYQEKLDIDLKSQVVQLHLKGQNAVDMSMSGSSFALHHQL